MHYQPESVGVSPSKMPVSIAIRKAMKCVPTGAGKLLIKPQGKKMSIYKCRAEGKRLEGLFNKIDGFEGVQLRVEPKDSQSLTLVRIDIFDNSFGFNKTFELRAVSAFMQRRNKGFRCYLALYGFEHKHKEGLETALTSLVERNDYLIDELKIESSILININKDAGHFEFLKNTLRYERDKSAFVGEHFSLPIYTVDASVTRAPSLCPDLVHEYSDGTATFFNLLKLSVISSHFHGIDTKRIGNYSLKPLNTLFVTSNLTSAEPAFRTILDTFELLQTSMQANFFHQEKQEEFYKKYSQMQQGEVLNELRKNIRLARKNNDTVALETLEQAKNEFISLSHEDLNRYEKRIHCPTNDPSQVALAHKFSADGLSIVHHSLAALISSIQKARPTSIEIANSLRGNSLSIQKELLGKDKSSAGSFLSVFGAIDYQSFANFSLSEPETLNVVNTDDVDVILDFDMFPLMDGEFTTELNEYSSSEIVDLNKKLALLKKLKSERLSVYFSREVSREDLEDGMTDKVLSVALALEIMQLSEESFVGKKPIIAIKKETYLEAKRFIDDITVERSRMLNRKRLLLSSTAIKILEKLSLINKRKWTTRYITQSEWSMVGRSTPFVNEVLLLLKELGIVERQSSPRADSFEWYLKDTHEFEDVINVLKGTKY
ncbi:hypothetical protein CW735_15535 [Alteromonas sp. MB-3u-76]|uniref:hypothetical protein n=1 Tax=Alteromonas sp. MB-3u-76 TaxID=2058133 RepID=UPI000C31A4A2|nr:hypothetical protein [Alteromonas sp. MB-3u-76]AUC89428.1 hypothetical protein CW735_15535 [Alteromonas sp. MB-3u-76]